ncbi:beta/gamma crystallin domain-containing protein [Streptomyces sp. AC550_RSS872]|uniref:beta/gamma crystallin domain-containing protein n=1 Tax=Streptomyces sp. AC550_RSS872 TaxID=2823689 RepID=UPI001C279D7F
MTAVVATSTSAHALNRTECDPGRYSFFEFWADAGILCFENAGQQNVVIYGVDFVKAGNNTVSFQYPTDAAPRPVWGVGYLMRARLCIW